MSFDWETLFASRVSRFQGSAIREMFHWAQLPGIISLSGGSPAPELFPVEAFRKAANQVLTEDAAAALQYGITEGYLPLREWIAQHLQTKGVTVSADQVLITTGSQQAMNLAAQVLLNPGDVAVVERPSFIGGLQALDTYECEFLSADMDDDGLIVEDLAAKLKKGVRPKLMYVQPNFQNPSGRSMSLARREALVDLAAKSGIAILEDDPYSELIYEGQPLPALKSFDRQDQTLYLGSFSKIFVPGIRIGWVAGPSQVLEKMVVAKQSSDLHTDGFIQRIVNLYVRSGELDGHIEKLRTAYRERRDAMLTALSEHFPPEAHCTNPRGGIFVWVELPEAVNCRDFLRTAVDRGVLFVGGEGFQRDGKGQNAMRLNFSNAQPDRIREAVAKLGAVIKEYLAPR